MSLREQLEFYAKTGDRVSDYLLQFGTFFEPAHETQDYTPFKQFIRRVKVRACYTNSVNAMALHGLKYYEGYYYLDNMLIPLSHAFNTDENGVLYDFTAHKFKFNVCEWVGVEIDTADILESYEVERKLQLGILTPLQVKLHKHYLSLKQQNEKDITSVH